MRDRIRAGQGHRNFALSVAEIFTRGCVGCRNLYDHGVAIIWILWRMAMFPIDRRVCRKTNNLLMIWFRKNDSINGGKVQQPQVRADIAVRLLISSHIDGEYRSM
jgi:hypothetical protein